MFGSEPVFRQREGMAPDFLGGGGEMGALMRAHDWTRSSLGLPDCWPQSLRTVVGLLLTSKFPMFLVWGPELAFLYNDGYRPIFGAKHPGALGRPFAQVWQEIWGDVRPLVDRALAGEATFHENLPLTMVRDGYPEEAYFTFSYSPVRDEAGGIAGMFCACTETTQKVLAECQLRAAETELREAKRALEIERELSREANVRLSAEAELRHAQKMEAVGQLTGGVAHDFNNLLQALTGCLQMIERRAPTPRIQPLIEAGQQAIDRGSKLVQQLMAFARRQNLRPEAVDVRDRILGMSELLARALRADIAVETAFEPDLWPVEVDPTQLELAIINLAVNARDAMPGGGRLRIETANVPAGGGSGGMVRLGICDDGSGMTPEVLARVFEPFFTTKGVGKGSGLGLAQVYGFARQSGGRVEIDSEPGKGTRVSLFLPRTGKAPADPAVPRLSDDGVTRGMRVLLVEDDPIVGNMVSAALEDMGYRVVRTAHAAEALAVLSSDGHVDLLFSDIVMPGNMSGLDLAQEARRRRPGLPVVLTTGYSEDVARAEGMRVLRKPYRIAALVETLEAAFRG